MWHSDPVVHLSTFFFSYYLPSWSFPRDWLYIVPCSVQQDLLLIHSEWNNLHLPTPNSPSIPLPLPSPWATTSLFSVSASLFLFCRRVHLCHSLDFTYKWYHMVFVFLFLFFFLGLHLWHMEVPRLGVKSELQVPAYTTAMATLDPSRVCNLHHSLWQRHILNPLSDARAQTHVLMDASQVH